jgi:copper(I)-binding protein
MIRPAICALVAVLAGPAGGALSAQPPGQNSQAIVVRDAWVRVSTARRTSSSGYCRMENPGGKPVTLVRITAAGVGTAQVHTMTDHDGQMSMSPVTKLTIPPHGTIDLAPGGTHIMLTDIARPLAIGATLDMRFTFDDGRTETVRATVRPLDAMSIR